jgi:hypothetical protein
MQTNLENKILNVLRAFADNYGKRRRNFHGRTLEPFEFIYRTRGMIQPRNRNGFYCVSVEFEQIVPDFFGNWENENVSRFAPFPPRRFEVDILADAQTVVQAVYDATRENPTVSVFFRAEAGELLIESPSFPFGEAFAFRWDTEIFSDPMTARRVDEGARAGDRVVESSDLKTGIAIPLFFAEYTPEAQPVAVPLGLPSHCDKCGAPLDYMAGVFGGASNTDKGFAGLRFCSTDCFHAYEKTSEVPARTTAEIQRDKVKRAIEFQDKHGE